MPLQPIWLNLERSGRPFYRPEHPPGASVQSGAPGLNAYCHVRVFELAGTVQPMCAGCLVCLECRHSATLGSPSSEFISLSVKASNRPFLKFRSNGFVVEFVASVKTLQDYATARQVIWVIQLR